MYEQTAANSVTPSDGSTLSSQLARLERELQEAHGRLSDLEARLDPLLTPQPAIPSGIAAPSDCPVTGPCVLQAYNAASGVQHLNQRIGTLHSRIKL